MPVQQLSYSGGINLATSLGSMPHNQLLSAENVVLSGASLVNRGGALNILANSGVTLTKTKNIFYWLDTSGNEWFIFGADDTVPAHQIYQIQNDGVTQSPTKISTVSLSNGFFKAAVLNGVLAICYNSGGQFKWTGSGNLTALGATWTSLNVNSQDCIVVNNFFFLAGSGFSTTSSNVYWSNVADATTFTSGNFIPFRQGDGEIITALSSIGTDLIIFKPHATGRLSTQTQVISGAVTLGPLVELSSGIGCIGPDAVDRLPDGRLILMGADGHAYIFDGSIFTDISSPPYPGSNIQSFLVGQVTAGALFTAVGNVFVRVYPIRNEVWFIIVNGTTPADIYVYDYFNGCWVQKPATGSSHYLTALQDAFSVITTGFNTVAGVTSGVFDRYQVLLSGDRGGGLWIEDCGIKTDQSGSNPTTQLEFSIPVPADDRQNFQRFFVLPLKMGSAQTLTYFTGRDGTYGSGTTWTGTGNWDRLKIPLFSSQAVTSYQVKITYVTSDTIQFDSAYVSDEVVQ